MVDEQTSRRVATGQRTEDRGDRTAGQQEEQVGHCTAHRTQSQSQARVPTWHCVRRLYSVLDDFIDDLLTLDLLTSPRAYLPTCLPCPVPRISCPPLLVTLTLPQSLLGCWGVTLHKGGRGNARTAHAHIRSVDEDPKSKTQLVGDGSE